MKSIMRVFLVTTLAALLLATGPLYASGSHAHSHDDDNGHHNDSSMSDMSSMREQKEDMFLVKKEIDGYDVSFHIMKAMVGKEMGGSHDFMIKVEQAGKVVTDIVMNTKVIHPNGQAEIKKTMKMGDWLMAGYDLGHPGTHQVMILFKTPDGKKHKGGVYYPDSGKR